MMQNEYDILADIDARIWQLENMLRSPQDNNMYTQIELELNNLYRSKSNILSNMQRNHGGRVYQGGGYNYGIPTGQYNRNKFITNRDNYGPPSGTFHINNHCQPPMGLPPSGPVMVNRYSRSSNYPSLSNATNGSTIGRPPSVEGDLSSYKKEEENVVNLDSFLTDPPEILSSNLSYKLDNSKLKEANKAFATFGDLLKFLKNRKDEIPNFKGMNTYLTSALNFKLKNRYDVHIEVDSFVEDINSVDNYLIKEKMGELKLSHFKNYYDKLTSLPLVDGVLNIKEPLIILPPASYLALRTIIETKPNSIALVNEDQPIFKKLEDTIVQLLNNSYMERVLISDGNLLPSHIFLTKNIISGRYIVKT